MNFYSAADITILVDSLEPDGPFIQAGLLARKFVDRDEWCVQCGGYGQLIHGGLGSFFLPASASAKCVYVFESGQAGLRLANGAKRDERPLDSNGVDTGENCSRRSGVV